MQVMGILALYFPRGISVNYDYIHIFAIPIILTGVALLFRHCTRAKVLLCAVATTALLTLVRIASGGVGMHPVMSIILLTIMPVFAALLPAILRWPRARAWAVVIGVPALYFFANLVGVWIWLGLGYGL